MKFSELIFEDWKAGGDDTLLGVKLPDGGKITVLDRLTGYGDGNIRDTETGYRDPAGNFWLASCGFDIRDYVDQESTVDQAIATIKDRSNTCRGNNAPPKKEGM